MRTAKQYFDVCILAGGLGTRLDGLWNGPKCLVPIAGKPVLHRLIDMVALLQPTRIMLALGYQAQAVINYLGPFWSLWGIGYDVALPPLGTTQAFLRCLPKLSPPILLLNGDTLPRYDLMAFLVTAFADRAPIAAAWGPHRCAGAALFKSMPALRMVNETCTFRDLGMWLDNHALRIPVMGGFLDVGTPEGFQRAQMITEEELK